MRSAALVSEVQVSELAPPDRISRSLECVLPKAIEEARLNFVKPGLDGWNVDPPVPRDLIERNGATGSR